MANYCVSQMSSRPRRPSAQAASQRSGQIQVWLFLFFLLLVIDPIHPPISNSQVPSFPSPTLTQVIFGPMFSGKSTELIRRLKRYQIARYECLIVKYAKDVRYDSESIATHDRQTLKAVSATILNDLRDKAQDYDVIGIDEGQFVRPSSKLNFANVFTN